MSLEVQTFAGGTFQANGYLLADRRAPEAVVIDPGGSVREILGALGKLGVQLKSVLLTHGHIDHTAGVPELTSGNGVSLLAHREEEPILRDPKKNLSGLMGEGEQVLTADRFLEHGERISLGSYELQVLHTPGHTPGSMTLRCEGQLFTGDTLFSGGIGRCDLPGGSVIALRESLVALLEIEGDLMLRPGHGPPGTLDEEREKNPFLADFL